MERLKKEFTRRLPALLASGALTGSAYDFINEPAKRIEQRGARYLAWRRARLEHGVWPYSTTIRCAPAPEVTITNAVGETRRGINFASQDYLCLTSHPAVCEAAIDAIHRYGLHAASAPALQGNSTISHELEEAITDTLKMEFTVLFPTGWGAGFGAVTGLMRKDDHVLLDQYAHNCTVRGALAATPHVHRFAHLSCDDLSQKLARIRAADKTNAILVVTEGIFSMDADTPNLAAMQDICDRYEAALLVDIAHDFGSCGPEGTGTIGMQGMLGKIDLVVGSFSKVFATNGGFVAARSELVKEYLRPYAPTHVFSNAISPVQCASALAALKIVRSPEGEQLRQRLLSNSILLRDALNGVGVSCLGAPGPVVPAFLGPEGIGRITAALCFAAGVFANLVEFPAVAVGASRFRMQLMASHTELLVKKAAAIIGDAYQFARDLLSPYLT